MITNAWTPAVFLCFLAVSSAQTVNAAAPRSTVAIATQVDMVIDGLLDEAAWSAPARANGFVQREPRQGQPAVFPTDFWVLRGEEDLYVGVRAHDPEPSKIRALLTRRDQDSPSDWIWINIDSLSDHRTAFSFAVSAAGVQRDYLLYDDVEYDDSWNAVWQSAVTIDSQGWIAEVRIPLSQLRFTKDSDRWGFQIGRLVQRAQEESYWQPWSKNDAGRVSLFGLLEGLATVKAGGTFEVVPYGIAGASVAANTEQPLLGRYNIGVDGRFRLSSDFAVSTSINPDFGQVEADPSDVNLTGSETFFPEKRPFFLEGVDLFRFGLSQGDGGVAEELFYSRRIGAPPHGDLDADTVLGRAPEQTTIYGAVKLAGKTGGGWSLGLLNATTADEYANLVNGGREMVEPLTNYSVLSLRKDLDHGNTQLGAAATAVHRTSDAAQFNLHEQAYAGGLSLDHRFWDNKWLVQAKTFGSAVFGSFAAVTATQEASQHYYQRPDADHLHFDPKRTALLGYGAQYLVGKVGGGPLRFGLGGDTRSPGFEVNDLGFQHSADYAVQWLWLQYRNDEPGPVLRNWSANFNGWTVLDYGGTNLSNGANINACARLLSYWDGSFGVSRNEDRWSTGTLRGGPALRGVPSWGFWSELGSDSRRAVHGNVSGSARLYDEGDAQKWQLSAELTFQAMSNLELSIAPFWSRNLNDQQYVESVGDRHLVARMDQTTLGTTVRVNYTLSPTLSVELYAQPLVSSGQYKDYREANRPRARKYGDRFATVHTTRAIDEISIDRDDDGQTDYSITKPDFNFRELRSNLVLRWEYLPGSTLFLVWSHARANEATQGRFDLDSDFEALADEAGEHVMMLKLSYRFES